MLTPDTCTTKGFINSQSNLIPMQPATKNPIEVLTASAATSKIQGVDYEREPTIASPLPKDVSCIKKLVCQNGGRIRIEWNPRNGINVCLFSSEGSSISIHPENLPREFHQIKCSRGFYQFMKRLSVSLIELDNGEWKISAFHPLRGGMMEDHSHLQGAKKAFKMIKSSYRSSFTHQNNDKFAILLESLDIFCSPPVRTGRQGLVHAILQHATGRYSGEPFSETPELNQKISTISTSSSESLDDIILQHTLDFIKDRDHLEICVTLIQANQDGKPVRISQIGNKTAHPVVIWKREDEYLALTTIDFKPINIPPPPPIDLSSNRKNPIEEAIDQLRIHLRDLKNLFVRQSIQDALRDMGNFVPSQGIASSFESIALPEESRQYICALSKVITEQARKLRYSFDLLVELERLNALGKERMPKKQSWEELDTLLKLDEIKKLPNTTIEEVMNLIEKGSCARLLQYLPDELNKAGFNLIELNRKLSIQIDRMSLDSLIRMIINRRPAPSNSPTWYDLLPNSFIWKILFLTNPATGENHRGVITGCQQFGDTWIFTLIDGSKIEIHPFSNRIFLSKFHNVDLLTAILIGDIYHLNPIHPRLTPLIGKAFHEEPRSMTIELISSDDKETFIDSGEYVVSTRWCQIPARKSRPFHKEEKFERLEITLKEKRNQNNYTIQVDYVKKGIYPDSITVLNQSIPSFRKILTPLQFKYSHFIRVSDRIEISEINVREDDENLQFLNELSLYNMKLCYLKIVKEKENQLRSKLLNNKHIKTLEYLLDNLIYNDLKEINLVKNLAILDDFKKSLNEIIQIYHEKLDRTDISPETLLKQIILDANYARLVDRTESILVEKAVKLIHEAYFHITKIRDKNVILFMGNTGSGKSTVINYLLGVPLEEFQNEVGNKAIKVKDGKLDPEKYPVISQSLGMSETVYGQGYEVQSKVESGLLKILVDCPGFNDTRGSDHSLCTSLSIDQIVRVCHSIECIILVVPIQAFFVDKANPIIELVGAMREVFPGAFTSNLDGKTPSIHMLITKHSPEEEENFSHLISTLFLETQKQLTQASRDSSSIEIGELEHRAEIWEIIGKMVKVDQQRKSIRSFKNIYPQNTLSFLNITDTIQSQELLNWYNLSQHPFKNYPIKQNYVPIMQNLDSKERLGRYIQNFVHTWYDGVVRQYLETVPKMIDRAEYQMNECRHKQSSLIESKISIETIQAKLEKEKISIEKLIEELGAVDEANRVKQKLPSELKERVNDANKRTLSIVRKEIRSTQIFIKKSHERLEEEQRHLQLLESKIERYKELITCKTNLIRDLSGGTRETLRREFSYQSRDFLTVNTIERSRMLFSNSAFETLGTLNSSIDKDGRVSRVRRIQANQFRGILKHRLKIPNEYTLLLNENIKITRSFWRKMGNLFSRRWWDSPTNAVGCGSRNAQVTGNRVSLNLSETIENRHDTIFCFETEWIANDDLPWFTISHSQPNIEYNAATIANRNAEISRFNELIAQKQIIIQNKQIIISEIDRNIHRGVARLKELEEEKASLRRELNLDRIEWKNEKEQELQILRRLRIYHAAKLKEIDKQLNKTKDNLENYQSKLYQFKRKKRDLAIIIQTQTEVASTIRSFITEILDPNRTEFAEIRALNGMTDDCAKFITSFDTHKEKLFANCQKDLSPNHLKDLSPPSNSSSYSASSSSSSPSSSSIDLISTKSPQRSQCYPVEDLPHSFSSSSCTTSSSSSDDWVSTTNSQRSDALEAPPPLSNSPSYGASYSSSSMV